MDSKKRPLERDTDEPKYKKKEQKLQSNILSEDHYKLAGIVDSYHDFGNASRVGDSKSILKTLLTKLSLYVQRYDIEEFANDLTAETVTYQDVLTRFAGNAQHGIVESNIEDTAIEYFERQYPEDINQIAITFDYKELFVLVYLLLNNSDPETLKATFVEEEEKKIKGSIEYAITLLDPNLNPDEIRRKIKEQLIPDPKTLGSQLYDIFKHYTVIHIKDSKGYYINCMHIEDKKDNFFTKTMASFILHLYGVQESKVSITFDGNGGYCKNIFASTMDVTELTTNANIADSAPTADKPMGFKFGKEYERPNTFDFYDGSILPSSLVFSGRYFATRFEQRLPLGSDSIKEYDYDTRFDFNLILTFTYDGITPLSRSIPFTIAASSGPTLSYLSDLILNIYTNINSGSLFTQSFVVTSQINIYDAINLLYSDILSNTSIFPGEPVQRIRKIKMLIIGLLFDLKRSGDWDQIKAAIKYNTLTDATCLVSTIDRPCAFYSTTWKQSVIRPINNGGVSLHIFKQDVDPQLSLLIKIEYDLKMSMAVFKSATKISDIKTHIDIWLSQIPQLYDEFIELNNIESKVFALFLQKKQIEKQKQLDRIPALGASITEEEINEYIESIRELKRKRLSDPPEDIIVHANITRFIDRIKTYKKELSDALKLLYERDVCSEFEYLDIFCLSQTKDTKGFMKLKREFFNMDIKLIKKAFKILNNIKKFQPTRNVYKLLNQLKITENIDFLIGPLDLPAKSLSDVVETGMEIAKVAAIPVSSEIEMAAVSGEEESQEAEEELDLEILDKTDRRILILQELGIQDRLTPEMIETLLDLKTECLEIRDRFSGSYTETSSERGDIRTGKEQYEYLNLLKNKLEYQKRKLNSFHSQNTSSGEIKADEDEKKTLRREIISLNREIKTIKSNSSSDIRAYLITQNRENDNLYRKTVSDTPKFRFYCKENAFTLNHLFDILEYCGHPIDDIKNDLLSFLEDSNDFYLTDFLRSVLTPRNDFTPLRIFNAQSASPRSLITAPKGGILNVQRCNEIHKEVWVNLISRLTTHIEEVTTRISGLSFPVLSTSSSSDQSAVITTSFSDQAALSTTSSSVTPGADELLPGPPGHPGHPGPPGHPGHPGPPVPPVPPVPPMPVSAPSTSSSSSSFIFHRLSAFYSSYLTYYDKLCDKYLFLKKISQIFRKTKSPIGPIEREILEDLVNETPIDELITESDTYIKDIESLLNKPPQKGGVRTKSAKGTYPFSIKPRINYNIEKKSSNIEKKSSNIEEKSSDIEEKSSDIEEKSSDIEEISSDIEEISSDIEKEVTDFIKRIEEKYPELYLLIEIDEQYEYLMDTLQEIEEEIKEETMEEGGKLRKRGKITLSVKKDTRKKRYRNSKSNKSYKKYYEKVRHHKTNKYSRRKTYRNVEHIRRNRTYSNSSSHKRKNEN